MPTAIASNPSDGPQAVPPAGLAGLLSGRGDSSMGRGPSVCQGAAGLAVDSPQPMRSCPYWFQIGLLPAVNEV